VGNVTKNVKALLAKMHEICDEEIWVSVQIRGGTSSSYRGGNFHEISFDDVIVLIHPWYNFFANGHI